MKLAMGGQGEELTDYYLKIPIRKAGKIASLCFPSCNFATLYFIF